MYFNYKSKLGIKFKGDEKKDTNAMMMVILLVDSTKTFLKMIRPVPSLTLDGTASVQVVPPLGHLSYIYST